MHDPHHWYEFGLPQAPGLVRLALEGRAPWELGAAIAAKPLLRLAPKGDGHPVLVFPGLIAPDVSTLPLRRFLKGLGYAACPWKQGVNLGPREGVIERVIAQLTGDESPLATGLRANFEYRRKWAGPAQEIGRGALRCVPTRRKRNPLRAMVSGVPCPVSVFIGVHLWFLLPSSAAADGIFQASTLQEAASAAAAARRAQPADPLAAFLHGEALSMGGLPRAAFEAYATAVELAVEGGGEGDAVVAGLALDAVLGLVAYLPRSEAGEWAPPDIEGREPWWLWARFAAARYRLAVAAIRGDDLAAEAARDELSCRSGP